MSILCPTLQASFRMTAWVNYFLLSLWPLSVAWADDNRSGITPQRPVIQDSRSDEDWSVLANPAIPHETLDNLKYILIKLM